MQYTAPFFKKGKKFFTGLFVPGLGRQTFPTTHFWQVIPLQNPFVLGLSFNPFFVFLCSDDLIFNRFPWLFFYNRPVCATSRPGGCKHSPSSSSVMAVDSNKVGPPKGDWGITNRKQMASYFLYHINHISCFSKKTLIWFKSQRELWKNIWIWKREKHISYLLLFSAN